MILGPSPSHTVNSGLSFILRVDVIILLLSFDLGVFLLPWSEDEDHT